MCDLLLLVSGWCIFFLAGVVFGLLLADFLSSGSPDSDSCTRGPGGNFSHPASVNNNGKSGKSYTGDL